MSMSGPAVLSSALMARKGAAAPTGYTAIRPRDLKPRGGTNEHAHGPANESAGERQRVPAPMVSANRRPSLTDREPPMAERARTRVSVRLDRERHLKLKLAAAHLDTSLQDIITGALDRYLERLAPKVLHNDCACLGIKAPGIGQASVKTGADQPSRPSRYRSSD